VLQLHQQEDEGVAPFVAERVGVRRLRGHHQGPELVDQVEAGDADLQHHEDDHRACHRRVHVPEQPGERHHQEHRERGLDEVGREAEPDEVGVRHDVVRGGGGIARDVDLGPDGVGEPAEDRHHEVVDTGRSGEALGCGHGGLLGSGFVLSTATVTY
jgi:hypothetical protein